MNNLIIKISEPIEITEQNFQCPIGNTLTFNLAFVDANGVAQSIADWTILFTAKKSKDLADTDTGVVTKTADIDGDGTAGTAVITLSKTETALLDGVYFYDITYIDTAEKKKLVVEGHIIFRRMITRRDNGGT